ncbi:MAG: YihY/virulence factor BrkB family protein [Bryobacteraceae bacterium]
MNFSQIKELALKTYNEFIEDQGPRLGAALAYYTALSLAPLLILLIALAGLMFGKEAAQGQLFGELQGMVGSDGAKAIEEMIQKSNKPSSGIVASIIGFLTLLFGASSVAGELKSSLNQIWNVKEPADSGISGMVKYRSQALVVVLGGGFLMLVSLVASSVLAGGGKYLAGMLPLPEIVLQTFNFVLSLLVITGVFAVLFKYLPDVKIEWRDVLFGAAVTALLFTIGKTLIGLYLGKASFGSTYGAAGSLIIVLVWIYYSSQIFFFGAEFTQVYSGEHGSRQGVAGVLPAPAPASMPQAVAMAPQSGVANAVGAVLGSVLAMTKAGSVLRKK